MADERKFALPDSMQFRAFYAQKRRRSRNSIVAPITRTFIDLDPIANAYYEMAAPITFAGDFEIEVDLQHIVTSDFKTIISGDNQNTTTLVIDINGNTIRAFAYNQGVLSGPMQTDISAFAGKLITVKLVYTGGNAGLYVNNILKGYGTWGDLSGVYVSYIGKRRANSYFNSIIANAKFTDKSGASDVVTTFKLNNSPAAENYTYSTELLDNNTFPDNANARQYLVSSKGWIITDGGAA